MYIRVIQRKRFNKVYKYRHRYVTLYKRMSITGIGSRGYEGKEVSQSAICKLENQESQ